MSYLPPSSTNGDLNDAALIDMLQAVVVGITGLPGAMVRPRWQPETPNPPDIGTDWAAIGPDSGRKRDSFSAIVQQDDTTSVVIRNRTVPILCSFYGPNAEANAERLAMGLEVPQNRETMRAAGFALVGGVGDTIIAPAILKGQWYYRADVGFVLRQQQKYTYAVPTVESMKVTLLEQDGSTIRTVTIDASNPPA